MPFVIAADCWTTAENERTGVREMKEQMTTKKRKARGGKLQYFPTYFEMNLVLISFGSVFFIHFIISFRTDLKRKDSGQSACDRQTL